MKPIVGLAAFIGLLSASPMTRYIDQIRQIRSISLEGMEDRSVALEVYKYPVSLNYYTDHRRVFEECRGRGHTRLASADEVLAARDGLVDPYESWTVVYPETPAPGAETGVWPEILFLESAWMLIGKYYGESEYNYGDYHKIPSDIARVHKKVFYCVGGTPHENHQPWSETDTGKTAILVFILIHSLLCPLIAYLWCACSCCRASDYDDIYGEFPVSQKCQFCHENIETKVNLKMGCYAWQAWWIISIFTYFVASITACFVCRFDCLFASYRDRVHECPLCEKVLGRGRSQNERESLKNRQQQQGYVLRI